MTPPLLPARAAEILERGAGKRVVVVGDVFLDRYLVGHVERVSREGPVPVLAFRRRFARAGGAANPACNLAALGASVVQVGVVGADDAAAELAELLAGTGIVTDGLVIDERRPTTVKTRIVADGFASPQQVARIDEQVRTTIDGAVQERIVAVLKEVGGAADAILVSHYRSGVVTAATCDAARDASAGGGWLTVDAQGDVDRFCGFDVVRIGGQDAASTIGTRLESEPDYEAAVCDLRRRLAAGVVMVGRGADGMSVGDDSGYAVVRPANRSEVFDVAGAGDTVIALMTLALASGATVREAVALANVAAGIVVRRLGVAAPGPDEIMHEIVAIDAGLE